MFNPFNNQFFGRETCVMGDRWQSQTNPCLFLRDTRVIPERAR